MTPRIKEDKWEWFKEHYEEFGFKTNDNDNPTYLLKYIKDNHECKYNFKDAHKTQVYRTLYVGLKDKRVFAYNDYFELELDLSKKWIKDLIQADLIEWEE